MSSQAIAAIIAFAADMMSRFLVAGLTKELSDKSRWHSLGVPPFLME